MFPSWAKLLKMSSDDYLSGPAPTFPSMLPAGSGHQFAPAYLGIDPTIFKNPEPKYILPQGSAPKRGRFELAFGQIGLGVMGGFAFGAFRGTLVGFREHNYALTSVCFIMGENL